MAYDPPTYQDFRQALDKDPVWAIKFLREEMRRHLNFVCGVADVLDNAEILRHLPQDCRDLVIQLGKSSEIARSLLDTGLAAVRDYFEERSTDGTHGT